MAYQNELFVLHVYQETYKAHQKDRWAARYNAWLLIILMPKGVVVSLLFHQKELFVLHFIKKGIRHTKMSTGQLSVKLGFSVN